MKQNLLKMNQELVVLAYSGGLDTSCILKWLLDKGFHVVCYMANVGQDEDFKAAREKALNIGAKDVVIDDRRRDFVENYMLKAVQMGLLYENRYLLGTSLARPCIAEGLVNTAKSLKAKYVSHGATGKGNDQVRFELSVYALSPETKVIAPWREEEFFTRFLGRQDLIKYAQQNGISVPVTPKEPWSMDANIMHISYESGILEDPSRSAPINLFQMTRNPTDAPNTPVMLDVVFKDGFPIKAVIYNNSKTTDEITDPLKMVEELNKLGGEHGVGRIDIVENRFIGLKSRGVYETPAGTILFVAHEDLEVYSLDKEVLRLKKLYQDRMSDLVYNGFWFSPEVYFAKHCLEYSQSGVTGYVKLQLYKGSVRVLARKSDISLYSEQLVSMDQHGGLRPDHATGFINIHAIRLKEFSRFCQQSGKM
ncbi:argininosuccinate synthase-like isoform X3 [Arctopsyche grandis]|uniref:argininosuccinate synthase-like isoform X3 n=1 Tax=Arctopsyche grandis TaxID=121162 RepID=UPI00406D6C76